MPKPRRPHVASLDELKITRNGDTAVFEYADPRVATTHFTVEAGKPATMTDADLLAFWNEHLERPQLATSRSAGDTAPG